MWSTRGNRSARSSITGALVIGAILEVVGGTLDVAGAVVVLVLGAATTKNQYHHQND